MGISLQELRTQSNHFHQLLHALFLRIALGNSKRVDRFTDNLTHRHAWIQRGVRILKHDLQMPPMCAQLSVRELRQILIATKNLSRGWRGQSQNRAPQGCLAHPSYAYQPER